MERENGPDAEQQVAEKNNSRAVMRHVEVFESSTVAGKDADYAHRNAQVPQLHADGDHPTVGENRPTQSRDQPKSNAQPGLQAKTIQHAILSGGMRAPVS